ncbi:MAG: phytanoyl-CoA dioxygenase family protein [Alphaproteobacteria bacterium]|nr:phytanoyl-CoA dioxygenase family protein [Alphaproteobacteria bacterium]
MPKVLTDDAVARYRRDGYYFPLDILTPAETLGYRQKLEAFEAKSGGPIAGHMRHKPHLLFPWLNDLVRHPKILDAVEDVLGPDLFCWSTTFFIKEPSDKGFVSWHQDATYWGLSSPDVMTVWLAMTPADLENGCMKFMAGSHHAPVAHRDTFDKHNLLTRGQEIEVAVDESEAVCVELKPGQASLHHVMLVHGSAPNRSGDRRIGFAIRYIPTRIRQIAGTTDSATLVHGRDTYGNFEHEPHPAADCDAAALAAHAAVTERQQKVLYRGTGVSQFRS